MTAKKKKNEKQFETIPFPFPTFIIEATRGVLVGTPCVYGALIGWRVARMPGYLCPEASPPWRKRCFRKRGLPLSADQSSTDPRPRKVVRGPLARARVINRTHCACVSRALLSPSPALQRVSIVTICHPPPARLISTSPNFTPRFLFLSFFSPLPPLPLTGVDEDKGHPVSREFDVLPVQRFLGGTASSERYAASYSSFVFVSRHVDPPPSPSLPVAFLALVAL